MSNRPVNNIDFWKTRIEEAKKSDMYLSVYHTSPDEWRRICQTHESILKEHATGRVLDAGCGYGRASEWFSPLYYLGVDFSPDFIEEAKNRYPNHSFHVQDLKNMSFKKHEFDTAFCISIKQMIIGNLGEYEWNKMEKELKRVAKKVILLEYSEPEKYKIL